MSSRPDPLAALKSKVPPEKLPQLYRKMALENTALYAQQYLNGPPEPPYNGRFIVSEHHEAWADLANISKRLCILASRDHGKSFFWSLAYPLWMVERHPGREGYIFSATQPQAERILSDIANEVETNPRLKHLLPDNRQKAWSAHRLRFKNGHRIHARGYGTKVRGAHPLWIVIDDGLNDEDGYSETVRQRNIEYFYTAITNMIIPGGQITVVGTPFHRGDLYGDLSKNKSYTFERFPAVTGKKPLWPDRYNLASLEAKRAEIGSIRFSREFLCEPVSDDASLFPLPLFKGEPTEQRTLTLGLNWQFWEKAGVTRRYIGVDFAMSSNVGADYTVLFVVGVDGSGNRWIIDIIRRKGLPFQQQLSLINDAAKKYNPAFIFLESNQMQRIFGEELIRTSDLPIKQVQTGEDKHSLEKGIPSLRVLFENGKIRIPRGDQYSADTTDIWIDEMRGMTFINGKIQSTGEHDDTCMAFYVAEQAARSANFGFAFGEQEGDKEAYEEVMKGSLPEIDDLLDDDEFYDEEEIDPAFILSAKQTGAQGTFPKARIVTAEEILPEDKPVSEAELKRRRRRRDLVEKRGGKYAEEFYEEEKKSYKDVQPKLGSPMAKDLLIMSPFWRGR